MASWWFEPEGPHLSLSLYYPPAFDLLVHVVPDRPYRHVYTPTLVLMLSIASQALFLTEPDRVD